MQRFGERFDHNLHALRIVERFERRYARFPGLNLTFEVREGIVKHSRDFAPGESPELDEYLPGLRPVLEAQLIDWADEIAYNTADLDDGYSAGMLGPAQAAECVPQYRAIQEAVSRQYPGAGPHELFYESLRQLIDGLVSGLIQGTAEGAARAGLTSAEEARACPGRVAALTPEAAATSAALKRFLHARVYSAPALQEGRFQSMGMLAALFQLLLDHPDWMPPQYGERCASEPVHRVVCDYIAGMTDVFFRRTYDQLTARAGF
jgi:dGTPase